jgi:glutathione reductase (NADPH)
VGGGYIAAEFAHVVARAGAEATIIHRRKGPLEGFDADLVMHWLKATRGAGIRLELNAAVTAVERNGNRLIVHASGRKRRSLVKQTSSYTRLGEYRRLMSLILRTAM